MNIKKNILAFIFIICLCNFLVAQENMPSREERLYALSLIWKEMLYNFAYPEELHEVDIDSLYKAYIPKVEQVKDFYEYYRILSAFMTHFDDAHTRIIAPNRPDDMPPLTTINFGEKIFVKNVAKSLVNKIPLKSEIVKIDNIPVVKYIMDSVFPYITASTPHWKFDKSVSEMLYGTPYSTVKITIKTPKGKEIEVGIVRNYNSEGAKEPMADSNYIPPINIKMINDIAYIQLTSCMRQYLDTINSVFNEWLPQLRRCKGLIIDIRGNRGGTTQVWDNIAYYLIPDTLFQTQGKYLSRNHNATYKNWGENYPQFKDFYEGISMEEIYHPPYKNELPDSLKLHQPLVVISGYFVASASEFFLTLMKETKRATIIGEPSVGAMSEPMFFPLPGGLEAMICIKKYINPDGTQPCETGILPDIEVKRDYKDYLKGKDNVLEQALKELRKQIRK